jgi:hypothetical protein
MKMHKAQIFLTAAASTAAIAAPASAQVYGNAGFGVAIPAYGEVYGGPYDSYGHGGIGRLQAELGQIRYEARILARQGRLSRGESRDLRRDIWSADRELREASYGGIAPWEMRRLHERLARLRHEVRRYADYDGRGWDRRDGYDDDDDDGGRDWNRN